MFSREINRKTWRIDTLEVGYPTLIRQGSEGNGISHMITLRDSVEIESNCDRAYAWLRSLEEGYADWHPGHVSLKALRGSLEEVGSEFECTEYLHGKLHSMRFRVTAVEPGRRVAYGIARMGRGSFEFIAKDEGLEFVAEVSIGSDLPVIGRVFDWIFGTFFRGRLRAMREHMAEEGQNLKTILESEGRR